MPIILWDIDGTLIRSGGAGKRAMEAALRSGFGVEELFDTVSYSGRTDVAIARDLLAVHGLPTTDDRRTLLSELYLRELPAALLDCPGEVLPGIPELLDRLHRDPTVVQGLLTGNIRRGAEIKLRHFGLWDFFGPGGFGDLHLDRNEVAKLARQAVEELLNRPALPKEIWVVGDTPHDISCGRAIGANVLAVATGWHSLEELESHAPDALFADLADVGRTLDLFGVSSYGRTHQYN